MKHLFYLLAMLSPAAFAHQPKPSYDGSLYASVSIGIADLNQAYPEENFAETEWAFNNGHNFSAAIGKDYGSFRLESDLSFRRFDFNTRTLNRVTIEGSGHQNQLSMMFNGIWQPLANWLVSPYIGTGIGLTRVSWNKVNIGDVWETNDNDTVFSYQFILGLNYQINQKFSLNAQYQNLIPADAEITGPDGISGKLASQGMQIYGLSIRRNF